MNHVSKRRESNICVRVHHTGISRDCGGEESKLEEAGELHFD